MKKRYISTLVLIFIGILYLVYSTLPSILPLTINYVLPKDWLFSISETPSTKYKFNFLNYTKHGISFNKNQLKADAFYFFINDPKDTACQFLSFRGVKIDFTRKNLPIHIDEFIFNIDCLALIHNETPSELTWQRLNSYLPPFDLHASSIKFIQNGAIIEDNRLKKLSLSWQFENDNHALRVQNQHIKLEAQLVKNIWDNFLTKITTSPRKDGGIDLNSSQNDQFILKINKFFLADETNGYFSAKGVWQLDKKISRIPQKGSLTAIIKHTSIGEAPFPIEITQFANKFNVNISDSQNNLLFHLPINISNNRISIAQGKWFLPLTLQPLQGNIFFSLDFADQNQSNTTLTARINLLTQGARGKSNLVLNIPTVTLPNVVTHMPFQLTGGINVNNLASSMTVPGYFHIDNGIPKIELKSGALVRIWGQLLQNVYIEEARFPLAGITVTSQGLNGRLQAILNTREALWGQIELHLDGNAYNLLPTTGAWHWLSWGSGKIPLFNAHWDMGARGTYKNGTLLIDKLTSGFDNISYGFASIKKPRLTIQSPIVLLKENKILDNPSQFKGAIALVAEHIKFNNGGQVDKPVIELNLTGSNTSDFLFKGHVYSERFKNITLNGRWDGKRLRGQAWWPRQHVSAFRNLFSSKADLELNEGFFRAQASFSAAPEQGFVMGGHLVFEDAFLKWENSHINGLNFVMPYYLGDHRWHFGKSKPVSLRITSLDNIIHYENMQLDMQGYYPFDDNYPLIFSDIKTTLLGGQLSIDEMQLPQKNVAHLVIDKIDTEKFWQVVNTKKFYLTGILSGKMDLLFSDPHWLIKEGHIYNENEMTLNIDDDFIDEWSENNAIYETGLALVDNLDISRFNVNLMLSNLGQLTLKSKIIAKNMTFSEPTLIDINYSHEENILALWQSISLNADLNDWLETIFDNYLNKQAN